MINFEYVFVITSMQICMIRFRLTIPNHSLNLLVISDTPDSYRPVIDRIFGESILVFGFVIPGKKQYGIKLFDSCEGRDSNP